MIIFVVLLVIVIHMSLVWVWYRITNNPSVVDVGWASGLTVSGLLYLSQHAISMRTLILGLLLLIWGLRLGGYLWWTRIKQKQIDKRYIALSHSWRIKKSLGFFINFQLQGILIFIVSISWYFISLNPVNHLQFFDLIGILIFIIALSLESIADSQLQHFRRNHPGEVCNQKLWRFSRHPNCFFEWLVWCSFVIFALSSSYGILSIISPIALYSIMVFMTIPITERESIKSRGQKYIEYQSRTPIFFPKIKEV